MELERKLVFSGWAYITRAEDLPGSWVAHCLDFDVVSIGESPMHAFDMVREAVGICLADDLNRGHDPHSRRASDAEWEPLLRLFEKHTKVPVRDIDGVEFRQFAVPLTVVLTQSVSMAHDVATQADLVNSVLIEAA